MTQKVKAQVLIISPEIRHIRPLLPFPPQQKADKTVESFLSQIQNRRGYHKVKIPEPSSVPFVWLFPIPEKQLFITGMSNLSAKEVRATQASRERQRHHGNLLETIVLLKKYGVLECYSSQYYLIPWIHPGNLVDPNVINNKHI